MNDTLLTKWWWRIINNPDSFVSRILWTKYGPRCGTWLGKPRTKSNTSRFHKDITSVKHIFKAATKFKIGNGKKVRFWEDNWSGPTALIREYPSIYSTVIKRHVTVASQWRNRGWWVRTPRLRNSFLQARKREMRERLRSHQCIPHTNDSISCRWNKNGAFSVKCIYTHITEGGLRCPYAKRIWRIKAPHKVKAFVWLVCKNAILTWSNLRIRGWQGPNWCILCKQAEETIDHLFMTCPFTQYVWNGINQNVGSDALVVSTGNLWHQHNGPGYNREKGTLYAAVCWFVWLERNTRIFNELFSSPDLVLHRLTNHYNLWTGTSTGGGRILSSLGTSTGGALTPSSVVRTRTDAEGSSSEDTT